MKSKLVIVAGLVVAAGIAFGVASWQSSKRTAQVISLSIPSLPDLDPLREDLSNRIQKANTEAKSSSNDLEGLQELSRIYHANGFTDKAMQAYKGLIAIEPKNPTWKYRYADLLAEYGRLDEATPFYEQVIKLDPEYFPSYIRLGETLLKQNRIEEAETAFSKAVNKQKNNAYALVGSARVSIAKEDWKTAQSQLEKAVQVSGFKIGADLLGDVYDKLGMPLKEQLVLQKIEWGSYADIIDPWINTLMNDCYDAYQVSTAGGWIMHSGDIQIGLRLIQRASTLEPENPKIHFQLAGVYMRLNNLDKATEHYQKSVEIQPDFADGWLALIDIAQTRNSPTAARRALEKGLEHNPNSPSLNIKMGTQLLDRKQIDKAIPYFKRAIENRPNEAGPYIKLATAYISDNRAAEGIELIKTALKVEPGNPIALTTMVFSSIIENDQAAADEWFEKMLTQARIEKNEVNNLVRQYQSRFGSLPKLK